MPKKTGNVMRSYLVDAPTPQATSSYTVISHSFIINNIQKILADNGFVINAENYTANQDAKVATGIYHVNYGNDPDLGMLFAFANSYDKTLRFQCAVGAYVKANGNSILNKDAGAWVRKHTGTSDEEAVEAIESQVKDAAVYFDQLREDKDKMKLITVNASWLARFVGSLFFMTDLFTSEQMSIIRSKFHKHKNLTSISLWDAYNDMLSAITKSHPRTWMNDQKLIHMHTLLEFNVTNFDLEETGGDDIPYETLNNTESSAVVETTMEKDPNQIDLEDMIEEVEQEQTVLKMEDIALTPDELAEQLYGVNNNEDEITMTAHVESDEEYNARVAEIEGEREDEVEIERVAERPKTIQEAFDIPQMPAPDTATDDEDTSDDLVVEEEEVSVTVEDVNPNEEFFMDKADLDEMHPDVELGVGFRLYIGDDLCEITSVIENSHYGLKMVTDDEEELLVEPDGEMQEEVHVVADLDQEEDDDWDLLPLSPVIPTAEEPEEEEEEEEDDIFEIGDGNRLSTLEVIVDEDVTESIDEAKIDDLMEQMNDKGVKDAIAAEIEDLYGTRVPFTYTLNGDQYNVTLDTGETIVLMQEYIDSLKQDA